MTDTTKGASTTGDHGPAFVASRRGFLTGLGALLIAAPAIVRSTSIMPVKAMTAADVLNALMEQPYSILPGAVTSMPPPMTVWGQKV